jgi:chemotaxis protein MotB
MSHGGDDELPEEHEEHVNHEAWVIPYADLLTLLMAMFIALFAMSTVDISKFKALAIGFNEALGGGKLNAAIGGDKNQSSPAFGAGQSNGPLSGQPSLISPNQLPPGTTLQQVLADLVSRGNTSAAKSGQQVTLDQVKQLLESRAAALGLSGQLKVTERKDGLLVTVVTDRVLFDTGKSTLRPESLPLLRIIGVVLQGVDNPLKITGYTDNQPFNGPDGNDFLSFARAIAVRDFLVSIGVPDARITDVQGAGPRDPVAMNDTEAHRLQNRRVEILVVSNAVKKILDANGVGDSPAPKTSTTLPLSNSVTSGLSPPVSSPVGGVTPNISPNGG